jgi:hypothetical protein
MPPGPKPSTPDGARRALARVSAPLTSAEWEQLETLAATWGCSGAEAVRRAVAAAWREHACPATYAIRVDGEHSMVDLAGDCCGWTP